MQHAQRDGAAREWLTGMCERLHLAMRSIDSCLRLELLVELAAGESDVSSLARALSLEVSLISKYLVKLHDAGVVLFRRDKKRHIYSLSPDLCIEVRGEQLLVKISVERNVTCELGVPIEMVNQLRAERGLAPLELSPCPSSLTLPTPALPARNAIRRGDIRIRVTEPTLRSPSSPPAPTPHAQ